MSGYCLLALQSSILVPAQQTQNICITCVQRRPNVFDVGPTLYTCYTNVLCLLEGMCMLGRMERWSRMRDTLTNSQGASATF